MHYIRIVRLIIFCLLLPLAVQAKREKVDMPDKPMVSDSILQCIFQFSPFYSRIIDEYNVHRARCRLGPACHDSGRSNLFH